jgi:hypothetical protein
VTINLQLKHTLKFAHYSLRRECLLRWHLCVEFASCQPAAGSQALAAAAVVSAVVVAAAAAAAAALEAAAVAALVDRQRLYRPCKSH